MAHCEFGYANHKRIPNGTKVEYTCINGARIKGVIVDQGESMHLHFQGMRVTSRNHPAYPYGKTFSLSTSYMTIRES